MLRIEVGNEELARTRFALSPVFELNGLLRLLSCASNHLPQRRLSKLVPRFEALRRDSDLDAVLALLTRGHGPGFLAVPPRTLAQTWDDDLAAIRATDPAVARKEITDCLERRPRVTDKTMAMLDRGDVVHRIADILDRAWSQLIAFEWPQLRAICERDVIQRATRVSSSGWQAAFDDLHQRIRWSNGALEMLRTTPNRTVTLNRQGLLLIPSVFVWPKAAVQLEDPWPKAVIYPARGTAALWETRVSNDYEALASLVGRTRARLLIALADPASTSQLARTHRLAIGAVGDHLSTLWKANLLKRTRTGRSVVYSRTALGDALAGHLT